MPDVPRDVRRNTWLLFAAQAALSTGLASNAQLGSLITHALSGTALYAGVPTAVMSLTAAAVGYPAGRFMDRRGRRAGLALGFALGACGALLVAAAVAVGSLAVYFVTTFLFSVGVAVGQLTRAAVADMYPASHRAGAVGLVVTGGLVGGVGGPLLVALGGRLAQAIEAPPLAVPWLFIVATFGIAALALLWLRPDPREIGVRLAAYFPQLDTGGSDTVSGGRGVGVGSSPGASAASPQPAPGVRALLHSPPAQAAMIALACAQATMVILMATASLMLQMHGHGLEVISLALIVHVVGMFGLSVPVGRLADRVGRRPVLVGGALLSASSGLMFTTGAHSAAVASVAFYLVGLGWCLAYVAGSAMLGDLATAATRARLVGISDMLTHTAATAVALVSGVLLAGGGEVAVGVLAAAVGSVPLLALARAQRTSVPPVSASAPAPAGGRQ